MKDLELIKKALEKANQRGVFTLEESAIIFNAVQSHERDINKTNTELKICNDREEKAKNAIKPSQRKTTRKGN